MGGLYLFAAAGTAVKQSELVYVWDQATPEAKAIIVCLIILFHHRVVRHGFTRRSQMRRARKLNYYFEQEFHAQKNVLEMFDRKLQVEGCPLYDGLSGRLRGNWTRACAGRAANAASSRSRSRTWSTSNARWKMSSRRNR